MAPPSAPSAPAAPLHREHKVIAGALAALSIVAWVLVVREAGTTDDMGMGMGMGMDEGVRSRLTMDADALAFIGVWVAMMVAMMFPTAAPMILTFSRVQSGRRESGSAYVPTALFVVTYLAIWGAVGVVGFVLASTFGDYADRHDLDPEVLARIAGGLFVAAGAYQLSSWKHRCLARCRGPMHYVLGSWRDGYGGAVLMGGEHALYCAGCCWLLFLILFPIGVMNVAVMGAVTCLILVEKVWREGPAVARAVGVALIATGVITLGWPTWIASHLEIVG